MGGRCAICGTDLSNDLFASVAGEPVCCICKIKYIGGLPSDTMIAAARVALGLQDGEYLVQDNGREASLILGRAGR